MKKTRNDWRDTMKTQQACGWSLLRQLLFPFVMILALLVSSVNATPLLWDDFESYSLGSYGLSQSNWTASAAYEVMTNPDSPSSSDVQSLSSPGGNINAVYFDTPVVESSGQECSARMLPGAICFCSYLA